MSNGRLDIVSTLFQERDQLKIGEGFQAALAWAASMARTSTCPAAWFNYGIAAFEAAEMDLANEAFGFVLATPERVLQVVGYEVDVLEYYLRACRAIGGRLDQQKLIGGFSALSPDRQLRFIQFLKFSEASADLSLRIAEAAERIFAYVDTFAQMTAVYRAVVASQIAKRNLMSAVQNDIQLPASVRLYAIVLFGGQCFSISEVATRELALGACRSLTTSELVQFIWHAAKCLPRANIAELLSALKDQPDSCGCLLTLQSVSTWLDVSLIHSGPPDSLCDGSIKNDHVKIENTHKLVAVVEGPGHIAYTRFFCNMLFMHASELLIISDDFTIDELAALAACRDLGEIRFLPKLETSDTTISDRSALRVAQQRNMALACAGPELVAFVPFLAYLSPRPRLSDALVGLNVLSPTLYDALGSDLYVRSSPGAFNIDPVILSKNSGVLFAGNKSGVVVVRPVAADYLTPPAIEAGRLSPEISLIRLDQALLKSNRLNGEFGLPLSGRLDSPPPLGSGLRDCLYMRNEEDDHG